MRDFWWPRIGSHRNSSEIRSSLLAHSQLTAPEPTGHSMNDEKIKVRVTETRQFMDVVVLSKRADRIEVVLGEGVHSIKCALTPTRTGAAYVGSVMGREIVYERSREQVQADIDKLNPTVRKSSRH